MFALRDIGGEAFGTVAFAQHAFDHLRRQHHAAGVVAAKALGVDKAHLQGLLGAWHVDLGDAQVLAVYVVGDGVDGLDPRNQLVLEAAQGGDQLVGAGAGQGVTDVGFDRRHRPVGNAEAGGHAVQQLRFGDAVGRGAGAVGVHEAAQTHAVFAHQLHGAGHGLGHAQVVARAGRGDGFFKAVGVDKHIRHRAVNIGAQLQGQFVIHQHQELAGLGQGEAAVLPERAAGAAEVDLLLTFNLAQAVFGGQGAHGAVTVEAFLGNRGFAVADDDHAGLAGADHVGGFLQVVEEAGAGAGDAAGAADAAQHIGVDKVRRHAVEAQGQLFGRDPAAFQARLHQAAEAIFIQLAHGAAGVDGDFVGSHLVDDGLPRQAD